MAIQCVIVGLEVVQQDWIQAIKEAKSAGIIKPVAAGQRNVSSARELGEVLDVPFYSDLRRMMLETTPQILIIDRPRDMPLDFIEACLQQGIVIKKAEISTPRLLRSTNTGITKAGIY